MTFIYQNYDYNESDWFDIGEFSTTINNGDGSYAFSQIITGILPMNISRIRLKVKSECYSTATSNLSVISVFKPSIPVNFITLYG